MEVKEKKTTIVTHLLLEDLEEASLISESLSKLDVEVIAHRSLNDLWKGLLESPSSMVLVDIRLMNSNGKLFLDHPYIKNGETEVVIFHREDDYPLLKMVNPMMVFDFLPESVTYDTFTFHTVSKLKKILTAEKKALASLTEVQHLEARLKMSQKETLKVQQSFCQKLKFNTFCENFWGESNSNDNFIDCFVRAAKKSNVIDKTMILYASDNGSTIRSLRHDMDIVESIPLIRFEKTRNSLMSKSFVKKTCALIARDKLGLRSHTFHVYDHDGEVSYSISIRLIGNESNNQSDLIKFLENFLNSEFKRFVPASLNSFFVNEFSFSVVKDFETYFKLNLSSLFEYIQKRPNTFLHKEFQRDFFGRLRAVTKKSDLITSIGSGEYLIGLKAFSDSSEYKHFLENFNFWSYFEDSDTNFSRMIDFNFQQLTKAELGNFIFGKSRNKDILVSDKENFLG